MGILESSRGRRVISMGERSISWVQLLSVAAAYSACYEIAYHLGDSHWSLTAGLRLACLLLLPQRFWPALALGEFLPLFEVAMLCLSKYGISWALVMSVPTVVLYMAWLKPMRQRWHIKEMNGAPRMGVLVFAALCAALTNAMKDTSAVWTLLASSTKAWPNVSLPVAFSTFMLGAYLGCLTLTPTVLAIFQRATVQEPSLKAFWRSRFLRDCLWVLPTIAVLMLSENSVTDDGLRQLCRFTMLLPVVLMTYRHGWHGTAIAGLIASAALAFTGHSTRDPAVIQCQVVFGAVISIGLLCARKPWQVMQPAKAV